MGLDGLAAVRACSPLPIVAIGGIDRGNVAAVIAAGADGIAVVSAVCAAAEPMAAARDLARLVAGARRGSGKVTACAWLEERFSGAALDSRLSWHCPPERWHLGPDGLAVEAAAGTDFWQGTHYGFRVDNGHALLAEVSGDFVLETRVQVRPIHQYDQAGLMVRLTPGAWLKTSVEFEPGEPSRLGAVITNHGWSDWSTQDLDAALGRDVALSRHPARLRLSDRGGDRRGKLEPATAGQAAGGSGRRRPCRPLCLQPQGGRPHGPVRAPDDRCRMTRRITSGSRPCRDLGDQCVQALQVDHRIELAAVAHHQAHPRPRRRSGDRRPGLPHPPLDPDGVGPGRQGHLGGNQRVAAVGDAAP